MRASRFTTTYCPAAHLERDWPSWTVVLASLTEGSEAFHIGSKLVVVDPREDKQWALAHVAAHLALGHVNGNGAFTAQQEIDASDLAALNLDLVEEWDLKDFPMDGDPSVLSL